MSCKRSINSYLNQCNQKSVNTVWNAIQNDMLQSHGSSQSSTITESPVKSKRGTQPDDSTNWDFLTTLNACLLLHKQYRDQIRHLRDSLGGSHALQHVPATSVGSYGKKYASPSLGNVSVASSKALTNFSPSLSCEFLIFNLCSSLRILHIYCKSNMKIWVSCYIIYI